MNRLTPLQREAAQLLFGLAEADGFALAGGSALVALGVVDRATRDLDAFVPARSGEQPGDVGSLVDAFESALLAEGWSVDVRRRHDTFARVVVGFAGQLIEVDLAVDSRPLFPVRWVDGIPTLAPEDLAARKVLAVSDRAEGRDFTDLWTLSERFGGESCIAWATELDAGVNSEHLVRAFGQLDRLLDEELPCAPADRPTVRSWFRRWAEHLGCA